MIEGIKFSIQVIRDSLRFYRANLRIIALVLLPLYFPSVLTQVLGQISVKSEWGGNVFSVFLLIVDYIIVTFRTSALIFLFDSILKGSTYNLKKYTQMAWVSFPAFFFTMLMVHGISSLALLLFLIPGIFLSAKFSMAQFNVLLTKDGVNEAIRHSYRETTGFTWKVIISCGIVIVIMLAIFAILGFLTAGATSLFAVVLKTVAIDFIVEVLVILILIILFI